MSAAIPANPGRRRTTTLPAVFIVPAVVTVFLVSIYPVFDALLLSLYQTRYAQKLSFIGVQNYVALWNDPAIWNSGVNSLVYTAGSLLLVIPLSLGLALLGGRLAGCPRWVHR